MKELGLNTVRVYQVCSLLRLDKYYIEKVVLCYRAICVTILVDTNLNHVGCMNILKEHGMYLLQDLASTSHSIIRTTPEYNTNFWNGVRVSRCLQRIFQHARILCWQ